MLYTEQDRFRPKARSHHRERTDSEGWRTAKEKGQGDHRTLVSFTDTCTGLLLAAMNWQGVDHDIKNSGYGGYPLRERRQ
jgi:hypothetical protein